MNSAIVTGVDKLLSLVNEKHEITLNEAAKNLKVDENTIESWAESLDHEGLLTLRLTLNERVLLSKHGKEVSTWHMRSFMRQIKNIGTRRYRDEELKIREEELTRKLALLKERLKEVKKLEKAKKELDDKTLELEQKKAEIFVTAKIVDTERKELEAQKRSLMQREQEFTKKVCELSKYLSPYIAQMHCEEKKSIDSAEN